MRSQALPSLSLVFRSCTCRWPSRALLLTLAAAVLQLLHIPSAAEAAFEPTCTYDDLSPILRGPTPTVLVLMAPWCAACRAAAPLVASLGAAASGAGLTLGVVDTDEEPGVAPKFGVTAFPTFLYFPPTYVLPRGKARTAPPVTYAPRGGDPSPRPPPPAWPVAYGDHRQGPLVAAWVNALAGSPVLTVEEGPAYAAWLASVGGVLPPLPTAGPATGGSGDGDGGGDGGGGDDDAVRPPMYLDREGGVEVPMELTPMAPATWSTSTFWSAVAGHRSALVLWGAAADGGVAGGMASALMGGADGVDDGWVVGVLSAAPGAEEPPAGVAVVDVSGGDAARASGTSLWAGVDVHYCQGWDFGQLFECINGWSVHRAEAAARAGGGHVPAANSWAVGDDGAGGGGGADSGSDRMSVVTGVDGIAGQEAAETSPLDAPITVAGREAPKEEL